MAITYHNLYSLVIKEIEKKIQFNTKKQYKGQLDRVSISPVIGDGRSDASSAEIVRAVQDILEEALPSTIIEGLEVEATDPISSSIIINSGKGSVGGVVYELSNNITISIPFDSSSEVFYINLYKDTVLIERSENPHRLRIAKIIIPQPGTTSLVQDDKDKSWNAYIVNFKEYKLYGYNDKFEEDTIELLRDNISPILADNLIGNIRLNEDLKIINTAGTLELDSSSLKLYDTNENLLAKFNQRGVYFYTTSGIETARFTNIDARIGNILITTNSLQSTNFVSGSTGFRVKDDGSVEFKGGVIGGFTFTATTLYGGIIQTGLNVGAGSNGVVMDTDGLRVYDDVLGVVVDLPSDGSAPSFSSGIIEQTIFEINTNSVLRTAETVGDGGASSAGILINNTGLYGCEDNQLLQDANLKALIDGSIRLKGTILATGGTIANITITNDKLTGGTIEGALLRSGVFETSDTTPRVRIDTNGLYFQETTQVGKYGSSESGSYGFKYGDGTKYGSGILAYLFNTNFPVVSVERERNIADLRLYNRGADPTTGTHVVGDLICVGGKLKICITGGTPGTFQIVGAQS